MSMSASPCIQIPITIQSTSGTSPGKLQVTFDLGSQTAPFTVFAKGTDVKETIPFEELVRKRELNLTQTVQIFDQKGFDRTTTIVLGEPSLIVHSNVIIGFDDGVQPQVQVYPITPLQPAQPAQLTWRVEENVYVTKCEMAQSVEVWVRYDRGVINPSITYDDVVHGDRVDLHYVLNPNEVRRVPLYCATNVALRISYNGTTTEQIEHMQATGLQTLMLPEYGQVMTNDWFLTGVPTFSPSQQYAMTNNENIRSDMKLSPHLVPVDANDCYGIQKISQEDCDGVTQDYFVTLPGRGGSAPQLFSARIPTIADSTGNTLPYDEAVFKRVVLQYIVAADTATGNAINEGVSTTPDTVTVNEVSAVAIGAVPTCTAEGLLPMIPIRAINDGETWSSEDGYDLSESIRFRWGRVEI